MSTPDQIAVLYQSAALLLSYPDEELLSRLEIIDEALAATPFAAEAAATITYLRNTELGALQEAHVQEFDISRRHALHLSYWTDGDTRRRGEALAQIKQVYRESSLLVDLHGELPDHLPLVLEFAVADPGRGAELLQRYRASLELLRFGLEKDQLPHAGLLRAICSTLPGPSPTTEAEIQAMAAAATPQEVVGLDAYTGSGAAQLLPNPTFQPEEITR